MDEKEWLTSTDPGAMLDHLQGIETRDEDGEYSRTSRSRKEVSTRKLRLFLRAACNGFKDVVEENMKESVSLAMSVCRSPCSSCLPKTAQASLFRDIFGNPFCPIVITGKSKGVLEDMPKVIPNNAIKTPYSCFTWQDGTIPKIAQAIYDERRWEDMPILADALEEAGCPTEEKCPLCRGHGYFTKGNEDYNLCQEEQEEYKTGRIGCNGTGKIPNPLLDHCRTTHLPGPTEEEVVAAESTIVGCCDRHADYRACDCLEKARARKVIHTRGCWVIDLLLNKK